LRRGPDHVDGTVDDMQLKSPADLQGAFGLSPDQFKVLNNLIGFKDPNYRVVSVGKSGNARRTVQLVFLRTGDAPQIRTWKEF
jgi:hypothetical protein